MKPTFSYLITHQHLRWYINEAASNRMVRLERLLWIALGVIVIVIMFRVYTINMFVFCWRFKITGLIILPKHKQNNLKILTNQNIYTCTTWLYTFLQTCSSYLSKSIIFLFLNFPINRGKYINFNVFAKNSPLCHPLRLTLHPLPKTPNHHRPARSHTIRLNQPMYTCQYTDCRV